MASQSTPNKKHPAGLPYLFFTEMWERFGYYLMLGIFALYMMDSVENGGMGFTKQKKSDIYGTYIGLVYLTPFIGGLLADRILGYRKAILIGGLLMALGYFGLAVPGESVFYLSLLSIILGNGFFKPNISTLLGNLYNNPAYIKNKDAGYNIFYAGINIGAFFCNFVAAYMRINYGWGWAFAAAGVGMVVGLVIFLAGTRHIREGDILKPVQSGDLKTSHILMGTLLPMLAFGLIGYFLKGITSPDNPNGNFFGTDTNDAFLFGCIPVILFFVVLLLKSPPEEKKSVGALLSVYACIVIFWAVFHQNGDALTVWAEEYTDREMPASISRLMSSVDLVQVLRNDPSDARSYAQYKKYAVNLPLERQPPPGGELKLVSAELFQSVNPFWVILLTPVIVGFFGFLRRRNLEPSTPSKIAIGLVITAMSALVMVAAVKSTNLATEKSSSWWLIAAYGVITVGELCLSPMGLSLVSKLSPPRITALMMGGFFLSTSVGNKLSGVLSGMWERYDDKSHFFLLNFALVMAAALMMLLLLRWLNKVMKEKNI